MPLEHVIVLHVVDKADYKLRIIAVVVDLDIYDFREAKGFAQKFVFE